MASKTRTRRSPHSFASSSAHRRRSTFLTGAAAIVAIAGFGIGIAGCTALEGTATASEEASATINAEAVARAPYVPTNDVEFNNYNKAQELYDAPDSIIWCTTTWGNASAPLVTIPIAGKLTSSSVSYFPNKEQKFDGNSSYGYTWSDETRSVDGMFHGTPGPYRYGFTPGGQYVDFTNLEVLCSTALTSFQRQSTTLSVEVDTASAGLEAEAEAALTAGDAAKAAEILAGLNQ